MSFARLLGRTAISNGGMRNLRCARFSVVPREFALRKFSVQSQSLRAFLRAFHERHPGVTAASMHFLADAAGKTSYQVLADAALEGIVAPKLLDIGCGNGVLLAEFAKRSPGIALSGIDFVPSEIALAKALAPTATVVVADVTQAFPFPDAAFNVVTAHLVMMLLGSIGETLDHVGRVLSPGGRFVFVVDDFRDDAQLFAHLTRLAVGAMGVQTPDTAKREVADPRVYDSRELKALLERHGFIAFGEKRVLLRAIVDPESAWGLIQGTYPIGLFENERLELGRRAVHEEVARMDLPEIVLPVKFVSVNKP